jgi:arsenate reductase (thioredoxin)
MRYVLFVCTHNAGRSQIVQAFFERYAPAEFRAESAGQAPSDRVWPNVVEAMREVGIEIADRRPKKLDLSRCSSTPTLR